ncbi:MAG: squalene synthase HpnC [Rhodospirillales bacterium]|nr:squalene synthase HpnC [Rhodospirillales bacterium]
MSATVSVEEWSGKDRSDENFPVGSLLIAARLRPAVHAFYAFARNADDIADSPTLAPDEKIARLDTMEAVLTGAQAGGSPSASALRASLAETGTTDRHARDLLIAFRQDASKKRYETWDALLDYCRHSAMPVGRHVLDLHGESRGTWPASDALCSVLQVLNHIQDATKDLAGLDRCYLPLDMLGANGASVEDLRAPMATSGLRATFDALLDRCDALMAAGPLPAVVRDRRLRLETAAIDGLARRLARRLRAGDPVARRVALTRLDFAASLIAAFAHWATPDGPGAVA